METHGRFSILDQCLCTILIAMLASLVLALRVPEREDSSGVAHEQFDHIQVGGDANRHEPILRYGWLYGMCTIALFTAVLMLGVRRAGKIGSGKWAILLGGAIYMGIFTNVVTEYAKSVRANDPDFFGPFPSATTWVLLGIWVAPMVFIALYVWKFREWIYTADDEERFQKLLAKYKPSKDDA